MQSSQMKKRVRSTRVLLVLVVGLDLQERSSGRLIIFCAKIKKLNCTFSTAERARRRDLQLQRSKASYVVIENLKKLKYGYCREREREPAKCKIQNAKLKNKSDVR